MPCAVFLVDTVAMVVAGTYTPKPGAGRVTAYVHSDRTRGPVRIGDKVERDPDTPGDFLRAGDFG